MADLLKGLFGAQKPETTPVGEDDFADFATAASPSPASAIPLSPQPVGVSGANPTPGRLIPYTKWYRVWERTQPSDFITEAFVLPFILIVVSLHWWGRRKNRSKAKEWMTVHGPDLEKEYASVGFSGKKLTVEVPQNADDVPDELLKEKTAAEYLSYASGRQNVAFLDIKLLLYKRYNPATFLVELVLSFLFETMRAPRERLEATAYVFDGREADLVSAKSQEQLDSIQAQAKTKSSSFDQFIWGIVNKEHMKALREERYDLSLTSTKDNAKLPIWATVMTESSEITDQLLTPELVKAVESAGDALEYLIVTDQPLDKPQNLNDAKPSKRVSLSVNLPSGNTKAAYDPTLPIWRYFLRLPDSLCAHAHFRPEIRKKIANVRDDEQRKLKKVDDEEKAEDRRLESEKKKKEQRDSRLKGMSAEEQRKFLEKERERSNKKAEKRITKRV